MHWASRHVHPGHFHHPGPQLGTPIVLGFTVISPHSHTLERPYKAPKSGICSWSVDLVMYQLHPHKSCDTNAVISLCDVSYTTIHSHSRNHFRYPSDFQNCRQFASSESDRVPQRSKALWILDSAFLYPTLRHRKLTNLAGRNPLVHKFTQFVRWIFQIREPRSFSGNGREITI